MKKPIIAVDIDEVLAVHNHALVVYHNEQYGTSHTIADYHTDYWSEIWGTDKDETERRAQAFHDSGAHSRMSVVEGAKEALRELGERYDLVAVTVRRKSIVDSTHAWLDAYFPKMFKDIRFIHAWDDPDITLTKADICEELGAKWLIDDSLKHCALMAESGKTGLLFGNYPWNQTEEMPEGVIRVEGWGEVLDYFATS